VICAPCGSEVGDSSIDDGSVVQDVDGFSLRDAIVSLEAGDDDGFSRVDILASHNNKDK
jgi:hypothetical protein